MLLYSSCFLFILALNFVEGIKPLFHPEEDVSLPSKRPRLDPDEELPLPIGIETRPIVFDPEEELLLPLDLKDEAFFYSNRYPQPVFFQPRPLCRCSSLYSPRYHLMRNLYHKPTHALKFPRQMPTWLIEQNKARRAYQTQKKKLTIGELLMKEGITKPPGEKITSKTANKVKDMKANKIHTIKDKRNKKKKKHEVEESIEMESEEEEYDNEDLAESFWDSDEDYDSDEDSSDANINYNYNVNTLLARRKFLPKTNGKKQINLYKKKKVG